MSITSIPTGPSDGTGSSRCATLCSGLARDSPSHAESRHRAIQRFKSTSVLGTGHGDQRRRICCAPVIWIAFWFATCWSRGRFYLGDCNNRVPGTTKCRFLAAKDRAGNLAILISIAKAHPLRSADLRRMMEGILRTLSSCEQLRCFLRRTI